MNRAQTRRLVLGILLMTSFIAVLVLMFMPLFDGQNAFNYLDGLYNSISKGSAYYVDEVRVLIEGHQGQDVEVTLALPDVAVAERAGALLAGAGATTTQTGSTVVAAGSLRQVLATSLADADDLYHNRGEAVAGRTGLEPRAALHAWWRTLRAMERELTRQKRFADAELVRTVNMRAVEGAYNYYGIEAQPVRDRWLPLLASLAFYVLYTVWYGYAVMFLFEGLGMRIAH